MNRISTRLLEILLILLLISCGGGGSQAPIIQNQSPQANAGPDQVVFEQTGVTLLGTGEDIDGNIASYNWTQVDGIEVMLTDNTSPTTSFTAPSTNQHLALIFELTVTDNQGQSSADSVVISVNPSTASVLLAKIKLLVKVRR